MGPLVVVRIAELAVLCREGVLMAIGLGSCVGVGLYDPVARVAGLAHVFLPASVNGRPAGSMPARYADSAVPALAEAMQRQGALLSRLVAKVAGGAQLFLSGEQAGLDVGRRNAEAVLAALSRLGIPVVARDLGGHRGRTMKLYAETGAVEIRAMGLPVQRL